MKRRNSKLPKNNVLVLICVYLTTTRPGPCDVCDEVKKLGKKRIRNTWASVYYRGHNTLFAAQFFLLKKKEKEMR